MDKLRLYSLWYALGVASAVAFGNGGRAAAQEATTIWAATMVVGEARNETTGSVDFHGYVNDYEQWGSLEPDQFTYGDRTYTVLGIWRNAHFGNTFLTFDDGFPGDPYRLTLSVGDLVLRGTDVASICEGRPRCSKMRWDGVEVDWELGDTIPVRLTTAAPPPPPSSPSVTASFGASSYEAAEGGAPATVEVRLSADPRRRVALLIGRTGLGGASGADYSDLPSHVVFHSGETRKTLTVRATDDAFDDDGESLRLSFGLLPEGVSPGSPSTTTISLVDNDQVGLVAPTRLFVDEGGTATYPVALQSRPAGTVTVGVSVPADAPFTATPDSLTFTTADWRQGRDVTVAAPLDGDDMPNPAMDIMNTANGGGYDGMSAAVQITVVEANLPSFGIEDARADEADGHMTFTVSLSEATPVQVTVDYATSDGSGGDAAVAGSDYVSRSGTLIFPPNTITRTFDVPIVDDREDEAAEETFTVTLDGAAGGAVLRDAHATGTIVDDDLVARFGAASYTAAEGGANASVSVVLSEAPGRELTIPIEATGLGGAIPDDYSGVPSSLVFGANQTNRTLEVVARDDSVDDEGESVRLSFGTLPATVTAGSPSTATVALTDDDASRLSVPASLSVDEGGSEDYTVVLESEPTSSVTVAVTVAAGSDLVASPPSLTFTQQNWSQPQTVTVTAAHDNDLDDDEVVIAHTASGGGYDGVRETVAVTIDDDDLGIRFDSASYTVEEGGAVVVTATLTGPVGAVQRIQIGARNLGGTTTADYEATSRFPRPGETRMTIVFSAVDDDIDDDGESVTLFFQSLPESIRGQSPSTATITIIDDDESGLSVPESLTVDEGDTTTYQVALKSQPTANVDVTVNVPGGSDLTVSPASFTFTARNWNRAQTVTVTAAHDEDVDDDEVAITHTASGGGYKNLRETVALTIDDDDLGIRFEQASYTVREGDRVDVVAVLTRPPDTAGQIRFGATNLGGATSPEDYTGLPLTAVVSPGQTTRVTVVFLAVNDDIDDDGESVRLFFASLPPWIKAGSQSTATVTIIDDDERGLSLPDSVTIDEGTAFVYNFALESEPTSDVTITLDVPVGSDIGFSSRASLTFTPANWLARQSVIINAAHDDDLDDDEVVITHTASGGGYDGVSGEVAVTIVDDDVEVRFGAESYSIEEGGGSAFVSLHLSRPPGQSVTIPLVVSYLNGADPQDLRGIPESVTFGPAEDTKTFELSPVDNALDDDGKQVVLNWGTLPPNVRASSSSGPTINIIDNDQRGISVPGTVRVRESSATQYSVRLASRPTAVVTVTLTLDRDDITVAPTTLTFQPAAWNRAQTVTVTGPSGDITESNTYRDVKIRHAATGGDYNGLSSVTTVRIEDRAGDGNQNPRRRSVARPVVRDRSASERADSMVFTVTPDKAVDAPVTFAYATSDGTGGNGAVAESDYTSTSGTVTFPANSTDPRTFSVPIIDDSDDEGDEIFTVTLSDPSGDGTVPDVTVTGTIEDDDATADPAGRIQVYFRPGSATATEGGAAAVVEVALSEAPSGTVVIPLVTASRGGASDNDYSGIPIEVAFGPGSMVRSFAVTATDDGDDDDGEFLHISFGALPAGMVAASPSHVRVDLADNDGGGGGAGGGSTTVSFAAAGYRVDEGSGIGIALMLGLPGAQRLEVPIVAVNRGGADGSDYAGVPASIVFEAGETTRTFVLSASRDGLFERDQTVELSLGDLPPGVRASEPATSVVTIVDEFAEPAIVVSGARASEADPSVVFVAQLTAPTDGPVSAEWKTSDGTAVAGRDYRESSGLLSFPTGSTGPVILRVPVLDDGIDEDDESFSLDLYDPVNVTRVRGAAGTIVDDDERGVNVLPRHLRIEEGSSGSYRVALGSQPAGDVTVTVVPGLETPIEVVPSSLTFTPGGWESAQTVTVSVPDDDDAFVEPPVTLRHSVAGGDYEGESAPSVEVVILETDFPGVSIDDPRAGEADGEIVFAVQLDKQTNRTVTVAWATEDGTAVTGEDYVGASGEVVFAPHETGKRVAIDLLDDGMDEPAENFAVVLAEPVNATLADPRGIGTIGDNDLPRVGIEAEADQVAEGEAARFRLFRAGDLSVALEVPVRVTQRGDYMAGEPPASVSFRVDADTAVLSVDTEDDLLDEADGAISVALQEGAGHEIAGSASAEVAVADNDEAPAVTISDARAFEGAGEIPFPVMLSAPSGKTISIAWTTAEGTATSGADFVAATGSLLFPPGRTADTIRVALVDDLVDERDETFTVSLGEPVNVVLDIGGATGTITDDDLAVARAWLSRFGRSVASQVVDAVDSRFSRASGQGNAFSLGGAGLARAGAAQTPPGWMDVLGGSSFRYSTVSGDVPGNRPSGWTTWGRGANTAFSGAEPEFAINGRVTSALAGVDYERGALLGGVLLSHSRGSGDFAGIAGEGAPERTGEVESLLTGVFPYLRVALGDRISAWGLAGRGSGSMTISLDGNPAAIGMNLGAFGARGAILKPGAAAGIGLDLKSDAFFVAMDSERSSGGIPAEKANASRVRLAVEGVRSVAVGTAGVLGLSLEAGLRRDGGDAETGMGIELGGGTRFSHRALGLTVEARARALLAHQDENYEEWGFSGALVFDPDGTTQGFSMRVQSLWGASMGGVDRLWSQRTMDGIAGHPGAADRRDGRLNARFDYGIDAFGESALMTPFAVVSLAGEDVRAYRLGWRAKVGPSLAIGIESGLGERTNSLREGMILRVSMRR